MSYNGEERRKRNWWPLVGYIILLVAMFVALAQVQDSSLDDVRAAEYVACERVQLLRDQANGANFLIYDYFSKAAVAQQEAAKVEKDPKQKKIRIETARRLQRTADTTVVTGPTDCYEAVYHPNTYSAPVPQFIGSGGPQVKASKARAQDIITKAYANEPLYEPGDLRGR